jgi:hypothetical protein
MDDLRLLKVLREVALRGSFSAAAEALPYCSLPCRSRSWLEAQAYEAVDRQPKGIAYARGRGARPPPSGSSRARGGGGRTDRDRHPRAGACGSSPATAAGTIVPLAVSAFRHLRPGVRVDIELWTRRCRCPLCGAATSTS